MLSHCIPLDITQKEKSWSGKNETYTDFIHEINQPFPKSTTVAALRYTKSIFQLAIVEMRRMKNRRKIDFAWKHTAKNFFLLSFALSRVLG